MKHRSTSTVFLCGHSLCVAIPKIVREGAALNRGDKVLMWAEGEQVILERINFEELRKLRQAAKEEEKAAQKPLGLNSETPQPVVVVAEDTPQPIVVVAEETPQPVVVEEGATTDEGANQSA